MSRTLRQPIPFISLVVTLGLLFAVLAFLPSSASAHENPGYWHNGKVDVFQKDWMASIKDDVALSQLSIPGTHDTGSYLFGGPIVETQSLDYTEQLESGIRAWDIRLGHTGSGDILCEKDDEKPWILWVHHGSQCQHKRFDTDVIPAAQEFLQNHPGETILMRVKHRNKSVPTEFPAWVRENLDKFPGLFYDGTSDNPTMSEMRGKIVILQQFLGTDVGIPWGGGVLRIQDEWKLANLWKMAFKWGKVKEHFINSTDGKPQQIYVNFLSAANGAFPHTFASGHGGGLTGDARLSTTYTRKIGPLGIETCKSHTDTCIDEFPNVACFITTCTAAFEGINVMAMYYLFKNPSTRAGIVYADYPGSGLILAIIRLNDGVEPLNFPPVPNSGGPYIALEGEEVTYDASLTIDPEGNLPIRYRWTFADPPFGAEGHDPNWQSGPFSLDPTAKHTWSSGSGQRFAALAVRDNLGNTTAIGVLTTVIDVPPSVAAAGDTIDENGTASLAGDITDGGASDYTVTVFWGDGGLDIIKLEGPEKHFDLEHQYLDDPVGPPPDDYLVFIMVIDENGFPGTTTATITVNNIAPTITPIKLPGVIPENGIVSAAGIIADVGTLDTFTAVIDWGEGLPLQNLVLDPAGGFQVQHQYLDDDPTGTPFDAYNITITATDDDGGVGTAVWPTLVMNIPPTINTASVSVSAGEIYENGKVSMSGKFSDPGTLDTFTVVIDWGEGSPEVFDYPAGATEFHEEHRYLDDDPTATPSDDYEIKVKVVDDDGGVGTTPSMMVTVNNVAPVITALGDTIDENGTATVSGTISDPGSGDTFDVVIDWGEGNPELFTYPAGATGFSEEHQYLDDNPTNSASDDYAIKVTVTDDDGGVGVAEATVTTNNVAPIVKIGSVRDETGAEVGTGIRLILTHVQIGRESDYSDVGTEDTHTVVAGWGDGSPTDSLLNAVHVFDTPGIYEVRIKVTDDDTGIGYATRSITVVGTEEALGDTTDGLLILAGDPLLSPELAADIQHALDSLIGNDGGADANGALDLLEMGNLVAGLKKIMIAISYLEDAEAASAGALDFTDQKSLLVIIAKSAAVGAVQDAAATAVKPKDLANVVAAGALIDEATSLLAAQSYVDAAQKCQLAVRKIQGLLP